MASKRDQRKQETHFKVMQLLDEDPNISTREIADRVGISNGAAYYCVTALIEKGFVSPSRYVTQFISLEELPSVLEKMYKHK